MEQFPTVARYVIDARIGQGGMAVVYRARHVELGTRHAIKVLSPAFQHIRDRIVQEGRIQAGLDHPNILAVTDVVDVAGAPGLVMPFVEGPSLFELMSAGPMNVADVDAIARGILAGVAEAHRHGIVHRDLKPANVLIRQMGGALIPKVADFGLAKVLSGDGPSGMGLSRTGAPIGTPSYMSPEQVRNGKDVDDRADIFAIGVICYEMLSGRPLFERSDVLETMKAVADGSRRPLREVVPAVSAAMEAAIERALAIDREQRWSSCDAMLAAWEGRASEVAAPSPSTLLPPPTLPTPPTPSTYAEAPAPSDALSDAPRPSRGPLWAALGAAVVLAFAAVMAVGVGIAVLVSGGRPAPASPGGEVAMATSPPVAATPAPADVAPVSPAPALAPPIIAPLTRAASTMPSKARTEAAPAPAPAAPAPPVVVIEVPPAPRAVVAELPAVPFRINTVPPSRSVTIDGKALGATPFVGKLPPGPHQVVFVSNDGRSKTRQITVAADVTYCWDFDKGDVCGDG